MSENIQQSKPDEGVVSNGAMASADASPAVDNVRRQRLAKWVVGAPVLMTLVSRPVLAGQCLSNMMSGNLSDPNRGHCSKGWSPGGWGQPGGRVHIYSTIGAWQAVGLLYGTYKTWCGNPNDYGCYKNGATLANVPAVLNKGSLASTTLLRAILTDPTLDQLTRHLVCAYLNALLSALPGSTFQYILTTAQVLGLAAGTIPLPQGYTSLQTFLGSTWN